MRWNPSKIKEPSILVVIGVCVVTVLFIAVWFAVSPWLQQPVSGPYAGGALLDSRAPMEREEDGEVAELGWRLVALAAGEKFTEEQVEQLKELVSSLFLGVRENSMGVEFLEFKLDKLEGECPNES